jgi:hypothetical protein
MRPLALTRGVVFGLPALAAGAAVFGLGPDDAALRLAMTLPFMAVVPGLAWCSAIEDRLGWGSHLALVAAVSLAFDTIVATLLVLLRVWSPERCYLVLVAVALLGWAAASRGSGAVARHAPRNRRI